MLVPGSRKFCTHESLWQAFPTTPKYQSVVIVAVTDKAPEDLTTQTTAEGEGEGHQQGGKVNTTPSFKRLSKKLMANSIKGQIAYADFWGYDHMLWEAKDPVNALALGKRPVAWGKLLALQQVLEKYEYALYLDSDLAIIQPMLNLDGFIEALEKSGKDLLVSQDGNGVNTGVMLFKRSEWSKWLLPELWRVGDALVDCDCIFYYEQRAFHHALQTYQWRTGYKWWTHHIPIIGWFRNSLRGHPPGPTLEDLPLIQANGLPVTAAEVWEHVELAPQCAFNAVDAYTDAEFIVHFAGHKGKRKERLMSHFIQIAKDRLDKVAMPLKEANKKKTAGEEGATTNDGSRHILPIVHQTWKTHELDMVKRAWHMSWLRNGFDVHLRSDSECLEDIHRLCNETGHEGFLSVYQNLSPVQRADFWRYAICYLEGGIYSDIDIGATPDTARFFLERWDREGTELVGIIENGPYDNSVGRFHWKVGMSPMYSRVPQLRQSFFYAKKGHPHLLELMKGIEKMVNKWVESKHTDIGKPGFNKEALHRMAESGALTLEMTGPGVWTDYMLAPLSKQEREAGKKIQQQQQQQQKKRKDKGQASNSSNPSASPHSIILDTMEGYNMIRYGSMGSWKTDDHKADMTMWRNVLAFYTSPFLLIFLIKWYRKYVRSKRSSSKMA